jgi:type I restriction enzyme S subunit
MDVYANDCITGDLPFMVASASPSQIARFSVLPDDVLLTKDSETPDDIAIPAVVAEQIDNLVSGYHLALLRPDAQKICGSFLAKQLCRFETNRHFANRANGSTRYGLTLDVLEKAPICHPVSLDAQQHIAFILSMCDTVLTQTKAAIEKYESIKQGMLNDLLTRGLSSDGTLRPHPAQAPDLYQPSPLGLIPKEWTVKQLGDEQVSVINPPSSVFPNEFVYIDLESVEKGVLLSEKFITKSSAPSRAQRVVADNDILYQLVRPYQKNNLLFKQHNHFSYVASTGYALIRAKGNAQLLYYQLHHDFFVNAALALCTGTGYPAITPYNLSKILVLFPPPDEQKAIATRLSAIDGKITEEQAALAKYKAIKEGLMSRLLTPPKGANIL